MEPEPIAAAPRYRLPAEWEPHEATWIAWPHRGADWPGKFGPVPWAFVEFVRVVSRSEPVRILVQGRLKEEAAREMLGRGGVDLARVEFFPIKTDRCWARDTLPSFVLTDDPGAPVVAVDWAFNGWAKYDDHARDHRVGRRVCKAIDVPRVKPRRSASDRARVVLEGGAIDGNGLGTLLTTEECLLDEVQHRNPGLGREDYERLFEEYLGVHRVIWLGRGITGDDTHGHVDDIARFVGPRTVVAAVAHDPSDEDHGRLSENLDRLRSARDQDGRPLDVVPLPLPRPVVFDGQRLPASYANFAVADGVVVVPTFNDPADRVALDTLAGLFPGREVVGLHAVDLVWGLGTIHCMTREQPRPAPAPTPAP